MKVSVDYEVTRIYPFIQADGEPGVSSEYINVYPNGTLRLVRPHRAVMTPEAARMLAEALLHAAGLAETRGLTPKELIREATIIGLSDD